MLATSGCGDLVGAPAGAAQAPPSALARAEIPSTLLPIYQGAAVTCRGLPWQLLAAIGWRESTHGGPGLDGATGRVQPPILGVALNGEGKVAAIRDPSSPDGWAHARGPMQFIPETWKRWATLAPERLG